MPFSVEDILSYVPLTETVKDVMSGIPKVLPDAFWTITEDVLGDRARNIRVSGTRKVARIAPYGAPPRQVEKISLGQTDVKLLHSIETMPIGQELYKCLREFESYSAQVMAREEINRQTEEFAQRMVNLEIAAVMSLVANGKIWFDADGNLLTTSSGADLEVDFGIPAGNRGDCGGIIAASWSNVATDIPTQVLNLKTKARQNTGYPIENAFYGKNVTGYLARNTSFQQYLARNPQYNQNFVNTGEIAPGTLGIPNWVPVQDAFFENDAGSIVEQFPADQVTFTPKIDKATYTMLKGSFPVPTEFRIGQTIQDVLGSVTNVYGAFRYAVLDPSMPLGIKMNQGTTFLPRWKVPLSVFIADTTP
jgi:hypothetical protein